MSVVILTSCSSLDLSEKKLTYEFESEWGVAYYIGDEVESSSYRLILSEGRIDENINPISGGASLSLMLNAPVTGELSLPYGRYVASSTKGGVYTFNYGITLDGNAVEGSYVSALLPGSKSAQIFPIDGGELVVELKEDGSYEVEAKLQASGYNFKFEYDGVLKTYNLKL